MDTDSAARGLSQATVASVLGPGLHDLHAVAFPPHGHPTPCTSPMSTKLRRCPAPPSHCPGGRFWPSQARRPEKLRASRQLAPRSAGLVGTEQPWAPPPSWGQGARGHGGNGCREAVKPGNTRLGRLSNGPPGSAAEQRQLQGWRWKRGHSIRPGSQGRAFRCHSQAPKSRPEHTTRGWALRQPGDTLQQKPGCEQGVQPLGAGQCPSRSENSPLVFSEDSLGGRVPGRGPLPATCAAHQLGLQARQGRAVWPDAPGTRGRRAGRPDPGSCWLAGFLPCVGGRGGAGHDRTRAAASPGSTVLTREAERPPGSDSSVTALS